MGKHWWLAYTARRRRDESGAFAEDRGAIVGVVGLATEVTEQHEALAHTERDRRELEDFFEHAAVGLSWVGPDGTILRCNDFRRGREEDVSEGLEGAEAVYAHRAATAPVTPSVRRMPLNRASENKSLTV